MIGVLRSAICWSFTSIIPEKDEFTGRVVVREVTYMTDYAQKENYVVMAIDIA